MNKRIYIEKKPNFQSEALEIKQTLNQNLHLNLKELRYILIYDVFNIEQHDLKSAQKTVFSEAMIDNIYDDIDLSNYKYFAIENLPGQYDQRADSAEQCVRLLNPKSECSINTGKLYLFNNQIQDEDLARIKSYLINPIETREKDLSRFDQDINVAVKPLEIFDSFIDLTVEEIKEFVNNYSLAMNYEDLLLIQDYFKNTEKRNPTETELKVLDTYWSDHCRHTTFETELKNIVFKSDNLNDEIQDVYNRYLELRDLTNRTNKPITLMDMATINGRYLKKVGKGDNIEVSDEINACSVFIDVDHNGETEKWLLQFKNETHNHPTEIEPFGGASTCIGGAIRDPLAGRAYVYQAMRITGCADVNLPIEDTLKGKLPQSVISKKATLGNSSYGNQIGLATTHVKEIYHDSYVAKHLEVGAVVGAVKADNVVRKDPENTDIVLLLGGRTGRDGIGGATGSSKQHTNASVTESASEVQKGNAPEERKIQRLFRNPECSRMIKKCNDFGAGGVCVAIGELASGIEIHLDKVRTKYKGLNATELAISESQERMAVVVDKENKERFIELCESENLECYEVASINNSTRLVMYMNDEIVCNIDRSLVDSGGVRQSNDVVITDTSTNNPFVESELTKDSLLTTLSSKNVASQKGLAEHFDSSIGSGTIMMPFGGKYQETPTQASVSRIPVIDGNTNTCSVLTYGFNPELMDANQFTGAMYSVLESMAKTIACGGNLDSMYFSFQEYFERLNKVPEKWGKVVSSLLGTIKVQDYFEIAAIGGKDSMSGTFNDLNVVPTLISFACSTANIDNIITPELKGKGTIGIYIPKVLKNGSPDLASYKSIFNDVNRRISNKEVISSYVVEEGGVASALIKMALGNQLGISINTDVNLLKRLPGAIIVESINPINDEYYVDLGNFNNSNEVTLNNVKVSFDEIREAYYQTYENLYPRYAQKSNSEVSNIDHSDINYKEHDKEETDVNVLVLAFPGTNCEYDMARAFEDEGAKSSIVLFRNLNERLMNKSIDEIVERMANSHILALPGGFSSGDEPDGSAKFIVNVLQNERIKNAINDLLNRDGLIIGICNGFQALIKSGLLPYGEIKTLNESCPTLYRNDILRHVSCIAKTRVSSINSPWLSSFNTSETHMIPMSHGEGKFVCNDNELKELISNGQIAFQYCDYDGNATMDPEHNINGSTYAIEGIVSKCGRIIGKMGHSERYLEGNFKNIYGNTHQNIFKNGVDYFRKGK